jgi:putative membrane protein
MVPHGCATHDFNLVSEKEIQKIIDAMRGPMNDLTFHATASRSERIQSESVSLLVQRFGDALLIVSTRSPLRTEDLDFNIGMTIMAEGHSVSPDILFVDAHNCMTKDMTPVHPATAIAREYMNASKKAFKRYPDMESHPLRIGVSHTAVPYSREEGFGDQGIQVLTVSAGGQTTAYVLFDGNNIQEGVREVIRASFTGIVDELEVMTTDSHVVNTISGNNPVGLHVPVELLVPLVEKALEEALADMTDADVAGSTVECEKIVIFGSQRIAQLASTVNAMLSLIAPVSIALLLLAFLLSLIAYIVIT